MRKSYVIGLLSLLLSTQALACTPGIILVKTVDTEEQVGDRLTGTLDIDPKSNRVIGDVKYIQQVNQKEISSGLSFFLPRHFDVSDVSGSAILDYETILDTSSHIGQFLKTIHISLNQKLAENSIIEMNFKYSGTVDLRGFAALDYPAPWIEVSPNTLMLTPIPVDIPEARYNLRIRLPSDYQVVAPGKTLIDSDHQIMIDSQDYIKGVYCVIGKGLTISHQKYETTRIRLVSYDIPESMENRITEMAGWTINYYNTTFGKRQPQEYVTIALRPSDEWDASFAAGSNYFVSYDSQSDFTELEEDYYATYAHEMAHFWWKEADALTNSNWLNEGFAEFSSMLAIKSFYGVAAFEKKIKYHEAILGKVPEGVRLGGFERFGKHDQAMSYSAGALLLNDIYRELGDSKFNAFLADVLDSKIRNTEQFVDYLIRHYKGAWLDAIISRIYL